MAADRVERCRELLHRSRAAWRAGHGDEAWALLDEAEGLQDAAPSLPAEVLAVRAGVLLLAERMVEAATTADRALASASAVGGHDRQLLLAAADARVTKASALVGSADRASVDQLAAALELLDEVALDPDLADTTPAARAVNNALNLRLEALGPRLHDTASQVEAWTRVGEARALTAGWRDHGSILRQAVDLAFSTGQWERGWDYAHRQLEAEHERNEQVAVLAKAAHLAWHRGMLPEARQLGTGARALSVAVDHPWVRTYAYLGGVLAAVAGLHDRRRPRDPTASRRSSRPGRPRGRSSTGRGPRVRAADPAGWSAGQSDPAAGGPPDGRRGGEGPRPR